MSQQQKQGDVKKLTGAVAKLGGNVFHIGTETNYSGVLEAVTLYMEREHARWGAQLMAGINEPPEEPSLPKKEDLPKKDGEFSPVYDRYKQDRQFWLVVQDEYKNVKSQVFAIVKGQCTQAMKNRLEALSDWKQTLKDGDVKGLLTLPMQLPTFGMIIGFLPMCIRRWQLKDKHGDTNQVARDKFLACMFLQSTNRKMYGHVADEFNNDYVKDQSAYPSTPRDMLEMSHRTDYVSIRNLHKRRDKSTGLMETNNAVMSEDEGDDDQSYSSVSTDFVYSNKSKNRRRSADKWSKRYSTGPASSFNA